MRNILPLIMFMVGAGVIVAGYALIVWLPVRQTQRRIEARVPGSPSHRWRTRASRYLPRS